MYVVGIKYLKEVEESVRNLMKGFAIAAQVLAILALAAPATATETAKGTCTALVGTNTVSYDCNYVAKAYEMGSPLTLHLEYACSVRCGGVLAFGLSGPGYTPKGDVSGHIVSVDRSAGAMDFTLMFDKLHEDSSGEGNCNGTAFMSIMLNVDDGTGRFRPTSLPFKVHVNSNGGSAGSQ
jgi:hypothetical protein